MPAKVLAQLGSEAARQARLESREGQAILTRLLNKVSLHWRTTVTSLARASATGVDGDMIPAGLISPVLQAVQQGEVGGGTTQGAAEVSQLRGQGQEVRALAPHRHQRLPPRDVTPQEHLAILGGGSASLGRCRDGDHPIVVSATPTAMLWV